MNGLQDIFKNCNLNNINFNNIITDKTLSSIVKKLPIEIIKDFNKKENDVNLHCAISRPKKREQVINIKILKIKLLI